MHTRVEDKHLTTPISFPIQQAMYTVAWIVAGLFVVMSSCMSMYEVTQHLMNYNNPALQRHVLRILLMVPIYAIDSWISLRFTHVAIYVVRLMFVIIIVGLFVAVVVICFLLLLLLLFVVCCLLLFVVVFW